jgi:hypothetical protein
MLHSQGLFNNHYLEPNQFLTLIPTSPRFIIILISHLSLGLPKDLFPVGLHLKMFKLLLHSFILAKSPAHLNLLDLIALTKPRSSPNIPSTESHIQFLFHGHSKLSVEFLGYISEQMRFYSVGVLASRQTKLEDNSWLAIHDCLFNIFTHSSHMLMSTPPSGTRRVTPCRDVRNPPMDNYGNRIYVFYETLNNFNGG